MKNIYLLLLSLFAFSVQIQAQTDSERQAISKQYNQTALAELQVKAEANYEDDQKEAIAFAIRNKVPSIVQLNDGGTAILQKIINDKPIYLVTDNTGASQTTSTNEVQQGGSLGLDLEGQGMTLGIWDGGAVRPTHLGVAGRVTQMDGAASNSDHGTHVAGTMMASRDFLGGSVTGMAPQAMLQANDFSGDFAEMIPQAADGLLVSNHSYGFGADNLPLYYFGAYDGASAFLDEVLYNAPYYLMVCSAGNDRGDGHNNEDGGYDLITDRSCAKNNITVAAVSEVTNYTGPEDVSMSSFSSWGPTDDGRIKPDLSAKGVNMLSLGSSTDLTVGTKSGTSMATPNVSGSLILLQQLHRDLKGSFMKAATVKALAIHTAREAGDNPGPDYRFGWGLLNMEAAAQALLDDDYRSFISEESLNQNESFTKSFTANTNEPLTVSIVWTDPAGEQQEEIVDDQTPRLVNDLDVRVMDSNGTTFMPWKLDVNNFAGAATTGDNIVDNVEKIEIANPMGDYTITVTHKGQLVNNLQDFSIVVTGINLGEFTLLSSKAKDKLCDTESTEFDFSFVSSENYNAETSITVSGAPENAMVMVEPSTLTEDGPFTVSVTNLSNVPQGTYPIIVTASGDGLSKSQELTLDVVSTAALNNTTLQQPANNTNEVTVYPLLEWSAVENAEFYTIELSTTDDFSTIVLTEETANTSFQLSELQQDTTYYWRIKPFNSCVDGTFSDGNFRTETLSCLDPVTASDNPQTITEVPNTVTSSIFIDAADAIELQDVNVTVGLTHTYTGDLTISIKSPSGTEVVLADGPCGENDDINATFDDAGAAVNCELTAPTLSGNVISKENLSAFAGEDSAGEWILTVVDNFNGDGGSLDNFSLELCTTQRVLGIRNDTLQNFSMYPNPARNTVTVSFEPTSSQTKLQLLDVRGRLLVNNTYKTTGQFSETLGVSQFDKGVYFVKISNGNTTTTKKLIIK